MKIKLIELSKILPYVRNYKIHSEKQIKLIASSIKEFGFKNPVLIDKDSVIVAGHARVLAAQMLELKSIPCIVADDLSPAQVKAYRIADNKLAELSEDNLDFLSLELKELDDLDLSFDLDILGIESDSLNDFLNFDSDDKEIIEDEVPELKKDAYSKPGDLWTLGNHRVYCGDSTVGKDLFKLMDGKLADMLQTDPPYNVDYEGKTKDALTIENDKMSNVDFKEFLIKLFSNAKECMRKGASFYIWHADSEGYNFRGACFETGLQIRQCLIWLKNSMVMGRQDYHWKHEPCLYGWKEGAAHFWNTDRKQTTVLEFNRPTRNEHHPTMKPVNLIAYQIKNNTKQGDIVLDICGGSGTTLIACEQTNRIAYVNEIDPQYVDVIVKRYYALEGKSDITLIRNNKTYHWDSIEKKLFPE